ncbi:hypothetical protein [Streptomyces rapamycinicus]|uniref:Uncharacterized protein n=2 Tax=Streptomyces rapamycinicus TaxID=1226757 RepID=A0A0A0NWV1_STRRN|nr:hypothetical protein [Streptomyces rapamycinicus]AGP60420.1 hypothetical protein M271_45270 [Streptomyces rapamycinicus NRRL 5491]MBB4788416.1 hypothetical protein [Streptomyces rapamycinicus]RLV72751.1 hypothetical protein D3C57_149530 [Streptomyces rapamycinicus NRRL 5491]UTP35987.1 hypothetical protein LIV37_46000 [Streptomyces rapamycinicus NRRL 5491]
MKAHRLPCRPRRIGALAVATSALVLATAAPALAHTEVSASGSRALAKNVTLTFESEASDGGSAWPAVGIIIGVCLFALAGGFVLFQQRRGSGDSGGSDTE